MHFLLLHGLKVVTPIKHKRSFEYLVFLLKGQDLLVDSLTELPTLSHVFLKPVSVKNPLENLLYHLFCVI